MNISAINSINFQKRYKFESKSLKNRPANAARSLASAPLGSAGAAGMGSLGASGAILLNQSGVNLSFTPSVLREAKTILSPEVQAISAAQPYRCAFEYASLGGGIVTSTLDALFKTERKAELLERRATSSLSAIANAEFYNKLSNRLNVDIDSPKYLEALVWLGDSMANTRYVDINDEDGILEDIAESNEPVIFIMNHPNQYNDPWLMMVLNSFLCEAYLDKGKGDSAPRPKFIMNEDIINTAPEKVKKLYSKIGAVGVNISPSRDDKQITIKNAAVIRDLIEDFQEGKNNIFIFPEGKNALKANLPLEQRLESGTSSMIAAILKRAGRVKVVPVGFGYDRYNNPNVGSIHISEPIVFEYSQARDKRPVDFSQMKSNINRMLIDNMYPAIELAQNEAIKEIDDYYVING